MTAVTVRATRIVRSAARHTLAAALALLVWGSAFPAGDDLQAAVHLYEARKAPEAKAAFTEIAKHDPKSAEAAYYLGRLAMDAEQWDEAVKWLDKATDAKDTSSTYHLWLARAYAQKAIHASMLKRPFAASSAHKEFERAVQLDPTSIDARFDLARFYTVAPGIMGGSIEKATQQAKEVAKLDRMQGHQCFAMIYSQQQKFDLVEQEYQSAIKENPSEPKPRLWLGMYYQGRSKFDQAFEVFEGMLKMNPTPVGAYYQIGKTAVLSGSRIDRGVECFQTYLKSQVREGDPPFAWAHIRLGTLYEKQGRKDLARQEYQAALKLQPANAEAKKALEKLG